MANYQHSTDRSSSSSPFILAVLGLDGADRALFFDDVAGTSLPTRDDEQHTGSATAARIVKTTIDAQDLWLIDTPSVSSDGELIRAVDQALEDEPGQVQHTIQAVVYLHDISEPIALEHAERKLATFKKLLSPSSQGSVLIVTTRWPAFTATCGTTEASRREEELAVMYAAQAPTITVRRGQDIATGESLYSSAVYSFLNHAQVTVEPSRELREMIIRERPSSGRYYEGRPNDARERDGQASALAAELAALKETLNKQTSELEQVTAQEKTLAEKLKHAEEVAEQLKAQLHKTEAEKQELRQQLDEKTAKNQRDQADEEDKSCANLNVLDAHGGFPLYGAAAGGHYYLTKCMLEQGADPSMRTLFRWTALHWAVNNEHDDVVELLLAHGADVNAVSDIGMTPLIMAKSEAVRQMLLEKGATA
ncbi:hypothetical protein B0T22DRAFT_190755 [Podospora appendiculata]|uniref:Uncharacterized protein n=1 Tax=Podospora appendiculata TaxID=314037 RepID=A0AAE0XCQ9_9PEZI|nr:hypothetical protein B0T22DRAFT_190755 [Podospora appendiculata]